MIRSCTKLYHNCTNPIYSVTRTLFIARSYSAVAYPGRTYFNRDHLSVKHDDNRSFSQQGGIPDATKSGIPVSVTTTRASDHNDVLQPKGEIKAACGDVNTENENDIDDAMEQEDMFVDAHESFDHTKKEWGGPRRGGRLPEPTRFGDWERKGRCSDF